MKKQSWILPFLAASIFASGALAQEKAQPLQPRTESSGGHEPPPQAYLDCKGKNAGDMVQHATREGKVNASCVESPKGLVARPNPMQTPQPETQGR